MKKQTRNFLILTIICTFISILLILVFSDGAYRKSPASSGGYGGLVVCMYFYYRIWKTHKSEQERDNFENELNDERIRNLQRRASYIAYLFTLCAGVIIALVFAYLHYDIIAFTIVCVEAMIMVVYYIAYTVYKRLY